MKVYGRDLRLDTATFSFSDKSIPDMVLLHKLLDCIEEAENCINLSNNPYTPSSPKQSKENRTYE